MNEADDALQDLIDYLYDAAVGEQSWQGLAVEIARAFDATSAVLKVHAPEGTVQLLDTTENLIISPQQQTWADHWQQNDLWVERSLAYGPSKIVTNTDLVPDSEFNRSRFYNDWTRHLEIYYMIGAVFPVNAGSVGVIGIHRPRDALGYDEDDRRRIARFLPHLRRAFHLSTRLTNVALAASAGLDALEKIGAAVLVVDDRCRLLFCSRLATAYLNPGSVLTSVHGRLTTNQVESTVRLEYLVQQAVLSASGKACTAEGHLVLPRSARLPLFLSIAPLRPAPNLFGTLAPLAFVSIRDPEAATISTEALRDLFNLTRTEAAVAEALSRGKAITEIAEECGASLGTIRTHLKKILMKTGTQRQAQLVALLLRSLSSQVRQSPQN
jgi:DNA-binding CsgD family transcriptional regulator